MESFAELAVHMEHITGTHDIAFADFNRGRMAHRPGWFGGSTALYPFTARKGDFVVISFIRLTGIKDKSRLAVEAYVFGDGLGTAEIGKEWEGDGWNGRGSGRRRPTEIGDGKDNAELAAFTGDFIDGHWVLLLGGMGSSENFSDDLTGALELGKAYVYSVSLMFIFPGEIPSSDSTKSSPSSSTINEFPVLNIKLYNPS